MKQSDKNKLTTRILGNQRHGRQGRPSPSWIGEVALVLSRIREGDRFDDDTYTNRFRRNQGSRQLIKSNAFDLIRMIAER